MQLPPAQVPVPPAWYTLSPWAAGSGTSTHRPGEERPGDGAWVALQAGVSAPFITLTRLSAPSGERVEARIFDIIYINHSVGLNGNLSSHNNKIP